MNTYNHQDIEKKWQKKWRDAAQYRAEDSVAGKENEYLLVEFPYPSGNLHVGHWYAFAVPDIYARMRRMQGKNVLYPIGFDAFGLPAENAAIKRGLDPRGWTEGNMATMVEQLESMGNSFDWSRMVRTCDPEYYRWTQWLFLQFYKKGLAYKKKSTVPWCASCKTVLANEQIVHGACERCGTEVVQKELDQWFFKITDYAERLLTDLDELDWPEEIKQAQREWIGKSEGSLLSFPITTDRDPISITGKEEEKERGGEKEGGKGSLGDVEVFTTRADTLYGVTYIVLAPEYAGLEEWKDSIENWEEVDAYCKKAKQKKDLDRQQSSEKTGVMVKGLYAINPANNEKVPVWVADYVLGGYGTGAVMAVPAHDERDWEFAEKYGLDVRHVIEACFVQTYEPGAVRKGVPFVEREVVSVVVRNPKNDTFIGLRWKKVDWETFITGGVEKGQTPEEAARAEVLEETGYKNLKLVRTYSRMHSKFFHVPKGVNRFAHFHTFLFDLEDEEREDVSSEEQENHDVVWLSEKDLQTFRLPPSHRVLIEQILTGRCVYTGAGQLGNSAEFPGMSSQDAKAAITTHVGGKLTVQYRLRDWLLSRQRYWGCPIPAVRDPEGNVRPVPEEHLPWILPQDVDFTPTGEAPLARSKELQERTEAVFGAGWKPEVDTMDTFVDSSWYFLRYLDPKNETAFSSKEAQDAWMPVARYSGGAEHTTMHLLYSRFFHKALFDMGLVQDKEPFKVRMNRGLILGPDGQKMSKSKGNVVDPGEHVERVGADAVKMFLAFVGPYNEAGFYPWDLGGIAGLRRFLERVWRMQEIVPSIDGTIDGTIDDTTTTRLLHQTIKKVTEDTQEYKFNTAISSMMMLVNYIEKQKGVSTETYEVLLRLLAPFAPHLTEELWERLGHTTSIHLESFPTYDETKIESDTMTIALQVNGKTRGSMEIAKNASREDVLAKARTNEGMARHIQGKEIQKEIYVPGRIVNVVV